MKPVKVGVIGCGVIGSRHLSIASEAPHIELVAAADLIETNRTHAVERFNPPKMYSNDVDLLDDDEIEAVVLAFPTQYRTAVALRAYERGKHVLIEKPIAMNAAEVEQLIAARGDLISGCCSSRKRFTASARLATQLITSGGLGELRTVYCRAIIGAGKKPDTPRPAWRLIKALNGGGILVNWGCYDLDYLLGLTGWQLKPQTVFAQTWTVPQVFTSHIAPGSDAETHYTAIIRCEDDIVLSVERGEFMTMHSHADWEIIGTEGSLKLNMQDEKPDSVIHNRTTTEGGVVSTSLTEADETPETEHSTPLSDFAAAIRENRQPATSLEKALVVQKITDAIYTSAATGKAVEIGG
ncbi:MAG: Gfo/Idh/MocA family oxidoreductase [Candidatus Poribacteria bacterium]|nr:Gfo/Idh/MocA family oxidoreductase [Candidatus Poribacteria bacterium]